MDDNGDLIGDAVVLELSWNDGSPQTHEITITVTGDRGLKEDIIVDANGVSTDAVEVGKKTKFYLLSSLDVPVTVEQLSALSLLPTPPVHLPWGPSSSPGS